MTTPTTPTPTTPTQQQQQPPPLQCGRPSFYRQHGGDTGVKTKSRFRASWANNRSHFRTDVFLGTDTVDMPDTVSKHLIESGDVETNPGPGEICGICGSGHMRKPIKCSECLKSYCKTDCVGPRWKTEKLLKQDKPVVCRVCKGEKISKKHPFNEGIKPDKCRADGCKKRKIPERTDFLFCTHCSRQYYKQPVCSG